MTLGPLVPFLDGYSGKMFPLDVRQFVYTDILPRLLEPIYDEGLSPLIGHDFGHILEIQRRNADRMRLFPLANPALQPDMSPGNSMVIILANEAGEHVVCGGGRLKWIETNLAKEIEDGTLFCPDPAQRSEFGEQWKVTARSFWGVQSTHVAWSLAVFKHPSIESKRPVRSLVRLMMLWELAHWPFHAIASNGVDFLSREYARGVYGYKTIEDGMVRLIPGKEDRDYCAYFITRDEVRDLVTRREFGDIDEPLDRINKRVAGCNYQEIAARIAAYRREVA